MKCCSFVCDRVPGACDYVRNPDDNLARLERQAEQAMAAGDDSSLPRLWAARRRAGLCETCADRMPRVSATRKPPVICHRCRMAPVGKTIDPHEWLIRGWRSTGPYTPGPPPPRRNPGGAMNDMGLTYDRWYAAATYGVPKGRIPDKLDPRLRAAWSNNEDPADWRMEFLGYEKKNPGHRHPVLRAPVSRERVTAELAALWPYSSPPQVAWPNELTRLHERNHRRYAQVTPMGPTSSFELAEQTRWLPAPFRRGLLAHEVGHVLAPHAGEAGADEAARRGLGVRIAYDWRWPGKGLQVAVRNPSPDERIRELERRAAHDPGAAARLAAERRRLRGPIHFGPYRQGSFYGPLCRDVEPSGATMSSSWELVECDRCWLTRPPCEGGYPHSGDPGVCRACDMQNARARAYEHRRRNPIDARFGGRRGDRIQVYGPTWPGDLRYWDVIFDGGEPGSVPASSIYTPDGRAWAVAPPPRNQAWRFNPPRGKRWELEPGTSPCPCGAQAVFIRNLRSGERLMKAHLTPDGRPCPEYEWQEGQERTRRIVDGLPPQQENPSPDDRTRELIRRALQTDAIPDRAAAIDAMDRAPLGWYVDERVALKIPVRVASIWLNRAEGPTQECYEVTIDHGNLPARIDPTSPLALWHAADDQFHAWGYTAPASGGYDKCDFKIRWEDGDMYEGRYDLVRGGLDDAHDRLRQHVCKFLMFVANLRRPAWTLDLRRAPMWEDMKRRHEESGQTAEALRMLRRYFPDAWQDDGLPRSCD